MTASARRFCTFSLAGRTFGIEVDRVQEVLKLQEMTPVPLASGTVAGLLNLRGRIVTALDLRKRLDLPPRPAGLSAMNVIVRCDGEIVSLLVDDIGDVVEAGQESFEPPPATLRGRARDLILGAHKLDSGLLLVLDTDRALQGAPD